MDDASLDDFLDAGSAASDEADEEGEAASDEEDGVTGDEEDDVATDVVDETPTDGSDVVEQDAEGDAVDETSDGGEAADGNGAVAPARSTMTFSPDPGECGACGEPASRRWTDGDDLVCRECKEW